MKADLQLAAARFLIVAAIFIIPVAIGASMSGCTSNPRVDFANAQDTYNGVVQNLVLNRDRFSDDAWQEDVLPAIKAGDAALDQYDVLTKAELDPASARDTLRQVLVLLARFVEQLE